MRLTPTGRCAIRQGGTEGASEGRELIEERDLMKTSIVRIFLTVLFLLALTSTTAFADGGTPKPCLPGTGQQFCP